ncbi:MAG: DUF4340 domain-containing protein, partial [Acetobacteraceae bacterium]|nr:DUF4340 domain-containing protein [Acetobacteraceae bacterium]
MRRYLGTVAVVAVFCALLGLFLWNRSHPAGKTEEVPAEVEVYRLEEGDVALLELEPSGVKLERGGDGSWRFKDAPDLPVDQGQAGLVASMLARLKAERKVAEAGADLAQYGLDEPQVQARVTLSSGGQKTLLVGDEVPVKGAYYCTVAPGDGEVYTLASHQVEMLRGSRDTFRQHRLVDFDSSQVTAFSLYVDGRLSIKASRVGDAWAMESPWACLMAPWRPQSLLASFASLNATEFASDHPSPQEIEAFGLGAPHLRLEYRLKGGGAG